MSCITLANMKKGVLLHKVILIELILAYWQAFNLFFTAPVYGWWLSAASIFLYMSNSVHNVIAWMKLRPFMNQTASRLFIGTIVLVQPYWVLEIYANFTYFNALDTAADPLFLKTRPIEFVFRDPWWVASCAKLVWTIRRQYQLTLLQTVTASPRFAVMLGAMTLSVAFVVLDIASATNAFVGALPVGINPFWKLALVFKCLTDTIILDDFKTALDRLWTFKISSWSAGMGPGTANGGARGKGDGLDPHIELATRNQKLVPRHPSRKSTSRLATPKT
ncbi:hypothetical protein F5Y15DRAFT_406666 [Xylariaceae sp. FL0016]|nr:hypothetical protein F5Y15DRAFT_406666 [Xylariaceae sp. FL0016]